MSPLQGLINKESSSSNTYDANPVTSGLKLMDIPEMAQVHKMMKHPLLQLLMGAGGEDNGNNPQLS